MPKTSVWFRLNAVMQPPTRAGLHQHECRKQQQPQQRIKGERQHHHQHHHPHHHHHWHWINAVIAFKCQASEPSVSVHINSGIDSPPSGWCSGWWSEWCRGGAVVVHWLPMDASFDVLITIYRCSAAPVNGFQFCISCIK